QRRGGGRRGLWWVLAIPAGLAVFLVVNVVVTGDALAFLHVQRDHFGKGVAWPWVGVSRLVGYVVHKGGPLNGFYASQELLFLGVGLAATVWAAARARPSYAVWSAGNLVLFASTSFIQSTPRYVLVIFPVYMLLARLAQRAAVN